MSILRGADRKAFERLGRLVRREPLRAGRAGREDSAGFALLGGVAEPNPTGVPWECEVIAGTDLLDKRVQENEARRVDLVAFDACQDGAEQLNLCLFAPRVGPRPRSWRVGVILRRFGIVSATSRASDRRRHRPAAVASFVVPGGRRLLAIASVPDDGTPWLLHHDLSADRLAEVLADALRRGFRVASAEADALDGSAHFSLLLLRSPRGPAIDLDRSVSPPDWPALLDRRQQAGDRLLSLSGYRLDGEDRAFAVWGTGRSS